MINAKLINVRINVKYITIIKNYDFKIFINKNL